MARNTAAIGRAKTAYGTQAGLRRELGSLAPRIAGIKRRMEEDEEHRKGRNLLLKELSTAATDMAKNRELTKQFRLGAEKAGVDPGERSLFDRIGITGPSPDESFMTERGMTTGRGLMSIGRGFQFSDPFGMRLLELLGPRNALSSEYEVFKPDTKVKTLFDIRPKWNPKSAFNDEEY